MAEDKTQATTDEQTITEPAQATDWEAEAKKLKEESRKWEKRSKENFEQLEALKEKADKWDELQEQGKSELERMTEQYQQAQAKVEAYEKAEQTRLWASEVSAETHVPASVLRGSTKEEMQEHAQAILSSGLTSRTVPDGGEQSAAAVTRESIEAIPDQMERIMARAAHPELYK